MMRRIGAAGLGYGQTFLLILGFLLTSGLIFLFGIWVGRDVAERRLAQEERIVRAAVPAAPTPSEDAASEVDRAFYERLKGQAYQRLQETAVAGPAPTPLDTPAPIPPSPAPTTGRPPLPTPALGALAEPAAARPTVAAPTRAPAPPTQQPMARATPAARPRTPEASGSQWADAGWTVQVNATTSEAEATAMARRLRAKGYDAYTVQAPQRGQTWYRVRVGRFTSMEQAKSMERRLHTAEGLTNAYVAPR